MCVNGVLLGDMILAALVRFPTPPPAPPIVQVQLSHLVFANRVSPLITRSPRG